MINKEKRKRWDGLTPNGISYRKLKYTGTQPLFDFVKSKKRTH